MHQPSLFDIQDGQPEHKPGDDQVRRIRVLITVKAAPNPSERYGETVCVAGFNVSVTRPGWIRLYPINFRELEDRESFRKYDIIDIDAVPARQDVRHESWRPRMDSIRVVDHLEPWRRRVTLLAPHIEESMCHLNSAARDNASAKSLALVRPKRVLGLDLESHPGWTTEESLKIQTYVSQLGLFDDAQRPRTALEAPRFRGFYRWQCGARDCNSHRQGILDWEFVALQRRFRGADDDTLKASLRERFLDAICSSANDTAFYVGNQAKRAHVYSVLGMYYPRKAQY